MIDARIGERGIDPGEVAAEGPEPQYSITIAVEVGLHQAAPPPPYCGYSPRWMVCAYGGTASSTPAAAPGALTSPAAGVGSDAIAASGARPAALARIR